MTSLINADTSGGLKITSDTSGALDIQSAGTTKFAMDSSGNVSLAGNLAVTGLMPAGSIMQVIQGRTKTVATHTQSSFVDIGLSATITPSSTSSKILVICNVAGIMVDATSGAFARLILLRGSTNVTGDGAAPYLAYPHAFLSTAASRSAPTAINYLDSPASTSALTYKIQNANSGGGSINFQRDSQVYSTMMLMEVAG